ncbi:MAG: phosphatase PAP2-related protein [Legionellaceae bacterium]|nr:phosphatase PAP2-related protein [Legionellaceae bacterium]
MNKSHLNKSILNKRIILVSIIISIWFVSQGAISKFKTELITDTGIADQVFIITQSINQYLNISPKISGLLLILTSLEVDILVIFLILSAFLTHTSRPFIALVIAMFLRQFCQLMTLLPIPEGMIWFDPGFPTLFVTYGVTNDFFFSGHTTLTIIGACSLAKIYNYKLMHLFKWMLIIFQITVILCIRAHYFMDIYAAIVTALLINCYIWKIKLPTWLESPLQKDVVIS